MQLVENEVIAAGICLLPISLRIAGTFPNNFFYDVLIRAISDKSKGAQKGDSEAIKTKATILSVPGGA